MPYQIEAMAGKPYRPSNGIEGMMFEEQNCNHCKLNALNGGCDIYLNAFLYSIDEPSYPAEWTHDFAGRPQCTAFIEGEPSEESTP